MAVESVDAILADLGNNLVAARRERDAAIKALRGFVDRYTKLAGFPNISQPFMVESLYAKDVIRAADERIQREYQAAYPA